MSESTQEKTLIVRYILGQVSAEERTGLEERYFRDSDLFEQMVAAENDLIDSYVRGELSGPSRLQFESRFLATPELRERVRSARAIAEYQSQATSSISAPDPGKAITSRRPMSPALRWAFAGLAVLLLVWASWTTLANMRLRHELDRVIAERASAQHQQQELQRQIAALSEQLQQIKTSSPNQEIAQLGEPGRPVLSLSLSPGIPRGPGKPNTLPISSDVSTALLLLKTSRDSYSSYSVFLETPEGKQILQRDGLKAISTANGRVVPISLSSSALQRGDYILHLFGQNSNGRSEEIDAYSFRVIVH